MRIYDYDHVGIRVSNREASLAFYNALGFRLTEELPEHQAVELRSDGGVVINLIINANASYNNGKNVLLDNPEKLPGVTHPAFLVDRLQTVIDFCKASGIAITEGPIEIGGRRTALFLRDPDGNVLEFDEIHEQNN